VWIFAAVFEAAPGAVATTETGAAGGGGVRDENIIFTMAL
jgi:hypothetical protein